MKTRDPLWRILAQSAHIVPSKSARVGIQRYALKKKIANSKNRMASIEQRSQKIEKLMNDARDATKRPALSKKQAERVILTTKDYVETQVKRQQERQYQWLLFSQFEQLFPEHSKKSTHRQEKNKPTPEAINSSARNNKRRTKGQKHATRPPEMPSELSKLSTSIQTALQEKTSPSMSVFQSMRSAPILDSKYLAKNRALMQAFSNKLGLSIITAKPHDGRIFLTGEFSPKKKSAPQSGAGVCLLEISNTDMLIINPRQTLASVFHHAEQAQQQIGHIPQSNKEKASVLYQELQAIAARHTDKQSAARNNRHDTPSTRSHAPQQGQLVKHMPAYYRGFKTFDRVRYVVDTRPGAAGIEQLPISHHLMQANINFYLQAVRKFSTRGLARPSQPSLYAAADYFNTEICVWGKVQGQNQAALEQAITPTISLNQFNRTRDPQAPIQAPKSRPRQTIHLLRRIDSRGQEQYQAILNPRAINWQQAQPQLALPEDQSYAGFSGRGAESLYLSILNAMPQTHGAFMRAKTESEALSLTLSHHMQNPGTVLDRIHLDVARQLHKPEYAHLIADTVIQSILYTQNTKRR